MPKARKLTNDRRARAQQRSLGESKARGFRVFLLFFFSFSFPKCAEMRRERGRAREKTSQERIAGLQHDDPKFSKAPKFDTSQASRPGFSGSPLTLPAPLPLPGAIDAIVSSLAGPHPERLVQVRRLLVLATRVWNRHRPPFPLPSPPSSPSSRPEPRVRPLSRPSANPVESQPRERPPHIDYGQSLEAKRHGRSLLRLTQSRNIWNLAVVSTCPPSPPRLSSPAVHEEPRARAASLNDVDRDSHERLREPACEPSAPAASLDGGRSAATRSVGAPDPRDGSRAQPRGRCRRAPPADRIVDQARQGIGSDLASDR